MKLYPLFLGLGTGEIILIVFAILLLFGASRIPALMKSMGKGVRSFKEGLKEVEKEINTPDETAKPQQDSDKNQE